MTRLNIANPNFTYDDDDPAGYRAGMHRLGTELGAERTGMSVYELPPGEKLCPYHYEWGEEEWLLVLAGTPWLRTPDGTETLEPFDVAFFTRGPAGAHQIGNDGEETARVLMWSEVTWPTATTYPDSDKVGVWMSREEKLMALRSSNVDYYEGEKP
jgi:uncharacterized cupin superfamily protein